MLLSGSLEDDSIHIKNSLFLSFRWSVNQATNTTAVYGVRIYGADVTAVKGSAVKVFGNNTASATICTPGMMPISFQAIHFGDAFATSFDEENASIFK